MSETEDEAPLIIPKKCKQESQPTPTINKKQKAVKEPKNKEPTLTY